ncbi:MAG: hypothetical protein QOH51_2377 [Acidobacteriota bacterium]|jgi:hypothetical protein|nr:hypothetical protein [Acidobacteriota bacterium]
MKTISKLACAALVGASLLFATATARAQTPALKKNWTPPANKIYGQKLVDEAMAKHPELLSITLHGIPPGEKDIYTMFAGSYPERIGNPDDPDDIDVTRKGITILDPRWKRVNDKDKKFVVLMPMQNANHENIGLVVYAFKNPSRPTGMEKYYLDAAIKLRDDLASKIKSYEQMYEPAK